MPPGRFDLFDALVDDGTSHVGVLKSDDADARACCEWATRADLPRVLDLRQAPRDVRVAARLEGWILGTALSSAGAPSPGARAREDSRA